MAVSLLDVNVMLALAWPNHVHHQTAHHWFSENHGSGWATCPQTEISFLRLSMQPAVVKSAITFADAMLALTTSLAAPEHEFWPLDYPITEIMPELRIASHLHLTGALLLDLAIRHQGKLATFDRRLASLLAPESPHRTAIEILPIERGMIQSFRNAETEQIFREEHSRKFGQIEKVALRKLRYLDVAESLEDLSIPGNHLEKLSADRKGQHSIRINKQYRICFRWESGDAHDVEITDYH